VQEAKNDWRELTQYPGYRINSDGQVQSRRKRIAPGYGGGSCAGIGGDWHNVKSVLLPNGYRVIRLMVDWRKGGKQEYIHRLVIRTFVGECPEGMEEVRHLNGIKTDNRAENLAWGTKKENWQDMRRHGTYPHGSRHGVSKLTEEKVLGILLLLKEGVTQREIAQRFGVTQSNVSCIALRKTWTHVHLPDDQQPRTVV
jgi:transcriptional regulator of met regulon